MEHWFRFLKEYKLERSIACLLLGPWLVQSEDLLSVLLALTEQGNVVRSNGSDYIPCIIPMASSIVRIIRSTKLLNFVLYYLCVWVPFAEFEDFRFSRDFLCS